MKNSILNSSTPIYRLALRRRHRPAALAVLSALIILEIVILSPSTVEDASSKSAAVEPETLLNDDEHTLATGIPTSQVPDYSVDQFQYVSTQGSEKQWKLIADRAFLYNNEKLVHSRQIRAFLYDPDGKITIVTGKESKYFMGKRDLEVYGDVHTTFPDGFEVTSDYLRYLPNQRRIIIPEPYAVHGEGHEENGQTFKFDSIGMDFEMGKSKIILEKKVRVVSKNPKDGETLIESDHALIYRDKQISHFTMDSSRPLATRFVHITQPTLFTRGRSADLHYGDYSKLLQYMTAYDDVLIKETGKGADELKYATGGQADFDSKSDIIRLTKFPQAYQNNDTVTGDVIIMHRDSDLVEVEQSNAYSQGN